MSALLGTAQFVALISDVEEVDFTGLFLQPHSLQVSRTCSSQPTGEAVDGAFLQFSSGTTGIKRGVLVSDEAVLLQVRTYARAIGLEPSDRIASWLPLYHDMGLVACLLLPLLGGVHCLTLNPLDWVSDPGLYLRAVSQYRATLGWNPNFAYAFMAQRVRPRDLSALKLSSLRGLVNCSEPVTRESQQRFLERFSEYGLRSDVFWGCYAMAETTFALTHGTSQDRNYLDPEGPAAPQAHSAPLPRVSVGRPLEGVDLLVVDDSGQSLNERQVGELWVRAPFTMLRYYHNPTGTQEAFAGEWYRTGDLGYRIGDQFYVCGRKKDLLIVGGVNLYPQDIEEIVASVPGVRPGRVSAFARFDAGVQTERIIVLVEAEGTTVPESALNLAIRQKLLGCLPVANFEIQLVPADWLVKSSAGKMARSANREKWAARIEQKAGAR
jgi:fatty-acyl-CoA synthase